MELVPLYPISKSEGVPLPNNEFVLEVPKHRLHLFHTLDIEYASGQHIEAVVLCLAAQAGLDPTTMKLEDFLRSISSVGVLCQVVEQVPYEDHTIVALNVLSRVFVRELRYQVTGTTTGLNTAYEPLQEEILPAEEEIVAELRNVVDILRSRKLVFDKDLIDRLEETKSVIQVMDMVAHVTILDQDRRAVYLSSEDNIERAALLLRFLIPRYKQEEPKVEPKKVAPQKRKLIEVGKSPSSKDNLSVKDRINLAPMPDEIRHKVNRDLERLQNLQQSTLEYSVLLEYLTWVADIPWGVESKKPFQLKDLVGEMDKTHYGLQDVKEHLVEHMTIEKLTGGSNGSVMCFVGPAGTGKTTLAKTIAEVANRKLIRMALGGMGDEAELRGHRRAQPLHSKILTPSGWTTMGQIQVGDLVCTPDGSQAPVVGIYPQGKKPIYEVSFHDGSATECCDDHLWNMKNRREREFNKEGEVRSLKEIMSLGLFDSRGRARFSLEMHEPLCMTGTTQLPLDPYLLGVLIGDADITRSTPILINSDEELLENCREVLARLGCSLNKRNAKYQYSMTNKKWERENKISRVLEVLGLKGQKSKTKFIPPIYLTASVEQRVALLQGLIDTDGCICAEKGEIIFSTISAQLAKDIEQLVGTLGGKVFMKTQASKYKEKRGQLIYRVTVRLPDSIIPSRLTRKMANYQSSGIQSRKRYLNNIELIGEEECQCIMVDHPDHLYITDDFIITHNTYVASRPGRLIVGLKSAGAMDPVILLDEVDKLSQSRNGDPSSALLEILDPEQNNVFVDRYLEFPVDLSRAMFICTANYEDQIPDPLRDRMEIIYFREYSKEERLEIISRHILPKVIKEYNMGDFDLEFHQDTIDLVSDKVQVRTIEKLIRKLLRRAAVRFVVGGDLRVVVDPNFSKDILGEKSKKPVVGFKRF